MSTKNNPGSYDCYAKALPDEPMFVLLARDPLAPDIIREWARRRNASGDVNKVREAYRCALEMELWRLDNQPDGEFDLGGKVGKLNP